MLLNKLPSWDDLALDARLFSSKHLSELVDNPVRQKLLTFSNLENFHFDFSKQRLSPELFKKLIKLAEEADIDQKISSMLQGEEVNHTEKRQALHSALRIPAQADCSFEDPKVSKQVQKALNKMQVLVKRIHAGQWRGFTGKPIKDVVNIGVGGSDLGPLMTTFALEEFASKDSVNTRIHFASSIDGAQLADLLPRLNPETTIFCIVSKSFTTLDTLSNATTAVSWLKTAGADKDILKKLHFIGISAKPDVMSRWGIAESNQLQLWDWVGGRYSLWSTVGFSIALRIGMDGFREFLAGAHEVDKHLASTPLKENIPVLMALVDVWNCNFLHINAHAILPYDGRLKYFPSYLEQLEMESNGKSVSNDGEEITYHTCPVLWGEVGPNAQHAFYQLLHQGTEAVNSDFIVAINRKAGKSLDEQKAFEEHHLLNLSNCIAQARVLALGSESLSEIERRAMKSYQQYAGNQPSTTILVDELSPATLGSLIALYEHKVFVSAMLWDINPFDQWGVELGKFIAMRIKPVITGKDDSTLDASTAELINMVRSRIDAKPDTENQS